MPETSKLEKLNWELEKSEKKLRKAINDEKALQFFCSVMLRRYAGSTVEKLFIKHRNLSKYSEMFHRKEHFPVVESPISI